ncbi:MAG: N-6 DNA methylase [Verrucomicrobiae bacterium]|nr:N-6 DNA methylase [Verrucomicrobiae bacterium]
MIREQLAELHSKRIGPAERPGEGSLAEARNLCARVLDSYWRTLQGPDGPRWRLRRLPDGISLMDGGRNGLCESLGRKLASLPPIEAGYELGTTYANLIPQEMRAKYGVFYTPPQIAGRLLDLVEEQGVDWSRATVLDPACGGGAFVSAVAERVRGHLTGRMTPSERIEQVGLRVRGYEIDPFSAWMSQVFAEAVMLPDCRAASTRLPRLVNVCDSLSPEHPAGAFDLVIGNPPYGKTRLGERDRLRFAQGVFGHANLYGLFTDQAVRWTKPGGMIAFVTPTSMLSGEYFKKLRGLLVQSAPPSRIEVLHARKGVFDGVLQETMLAVYSRSAKARPVRVSSLGFSAAGGDLVSTRAGDCELPFDPTAAWLLPRDAEDAPIVRAAAAKRMRLRDYGYRVKTGPLVWNRHKTQLRDELEPGALPLIWAECVQRDGLFEFRALKRNHSPWFQPEARQEWLVLNEPCVLVQRTTAKEQNRRLVAAVLPASFVRKSRGVVVENHLNMVLPEASNASAGLGAVAAVLNSGIADRLFRCLSGSVAVSAFELGSLPMPDPHEMAEIDKVISHGGGQPEIERILCKCYGES